MFRWGKRAFTRTLGRNLPGVPMPPGRLFRRAGVLGPIVAWLAGMAIHDLRQPQSRIRAFARRMLERRSKPRRVTAVVVGPEAGPGHGGLIEQAGKNGKRGKEG
mgnify:FL=1